MITLDLGQESMHLEHVIMPNARTYPKIIETYYTKGPRTSPTRFLSNCVTTAVVYLASFQLSASA